MKYFMALLLMMAFTAYGANKAYAPNNGVAAPGTFSTKTTDISPSTSETGMVNSSGVTTDDMNTSPNPAPKTEKDLTKNSTITTDKVYKSKPYRSSTVKPAPRPEIQAQEDALDYSTAPTRKTVPQQ